MKIDRQALLQGFILVASLAVLPLALSLNACLTAATSPNEPAAAVTGDWAAAWPDTAAPVGLVSMSLGAGGAYQVTIDAKGVPVERERGAWLLRASRVVFSPATCEAAPAQGEALALVTCTGPDSLPVDVQGAAWPVRYTAGGQLLLLTFHRI